MRRRAAILLVVGGLLCCLACKPKVFRIHGSGDPATTVNVLFLGDGFSESEIGSYRAAAHHLKDSLLREWPWCRIADRMQFYRIDVVDATGVAESCLVPCGSASKLPVDGSFSLPAGSEMFGNVELWADDLGVERCGNTARCSMFRAGTIAKAKAHALAMRAPNIQFIVVIANSQLPAGSGHLYPVGGSQGFSIVGVPMQGTIGDYSISVEGERLFSHELAHAFGLLDEYSSGFAASSPILPPGNRNVWLPPHAGPWHGEPVYAIPWGALLNANCDSEAMDACCGRRVGDACQACSLVDTAGLCAFVPAECQDPLETCTNYTCAAPETCPNVSVPEDELCRLTSVCDQHPAAWEGAAYKFEGRYRSSWRCRMRSLGNDPPFCKACGEALWRNWFCGTTPCTTLAPLQLGQWPTCN